MEKQGKTAIRLRYTMRFFAGMSFLAAAVGLTYWLLVHLQVRNLFGLLAIVVFLGIPSLMAICTLPVEFIGLVGVWKSDDPAAWERAMDEVRERNPH